VPVVHVVQVSRVLPSAWYVFLGPCAVRKPCAGHVPYAVRGPILSACPCVVRILRASPCRPCAVCCHPHGTPCWDRVPSVSHVLVMCHKPSVVLCCPHAVCHPHTACYPCTLRHPYSIRVRILSVVRVQCGVCVPCAIHKRVPCAVCMPCAILITCSFCMPYAIHVLFVFYMLPVSRYAIYTIYTIV
jgi:hypothetical protein